MARSTQEIYNQIIAEKQTFSSLDNLLPPGETATNLLSDLGSTSKVAVWRLLMWIFAHFTHLQEVLWDAYQTQVLSAVQDNRWGSLSWYAAIAREWQAGDILTLVNNYPGYAVVDTAKRIITQAAAAEAGGSVIVKAAKGSAPALAPLSQVELVQFASYMQQRKPAGVSLSVVSLPADQFRIVCTVFYDAILIPTDVKAELEAAISAYLAGLGFAGRFRRLALEDAMQRVVGVKGFAITAMSAVQGGNTSEITQDYNSQAGWMQLDLGNSSITMSPSPV